MIFQGNKSKLRAGAEIDWSNPLTKGLQVCLLFNQDSAKREIDLVNKIPFIPYYGLAANTIKKQGSEYGQALYAEGAMLPENYATFDDRWKDQVVTLIIGAKENRTDGYGGYGGVGNTAGGNALKVQWNNSVTDLNITAILNNPFAVPSVTLTIPKNDSRIISASVGKNGLNVYLNGYLAGSASSTGTLYPYNNLTPYLAAGDIQYNGGNTDLYFGYFWNRELNADEILKISKDPFCFIKKPKKFYAKLLGSLFTQTLNENQSFNDILAKLTNKNISENVTNTDNIFKSIGKLFSENQSLADTVLAIRTFLKSLTESINITDSLIKTVNKSFIEVQNYADTLIKFITKTFSENQTIADTLNKIKVILKSLTESFTASDSLIKSINKNLNEAQSYVNILIKSISKSFTENVTNSDTLTKIKVILKTFTESVTNSDVLNKVISKTFSEAQTIADLLNRLIKKTFSENSTFLDFLTSVYTAAGAGITNVKNYILKLIFQTGYSIRGTKRSGTIKNSNKANSLKLPK